MAKPLTIEFGALDAVNNDIPFEDPIGYGCASAMCSAERLREQCSNVDFTFLPYEGIVSFLSGGRKRKISPDNLIRCIRIYNECGFPFSVPFNGGLRMRDVPLDILNDRRFQTELRVLDVLAESGAKNGVENHVTILHDSLLEVVRDKFPDLKTIASCVRFVGGRRDIFKGVEEYTRAFDEFDLVVPLNQHTTRQFLSQFRERVDQMLLFLNLECCRADVMECYDHYCRLEPFAGKGDPVRTEDFDCIESPEIDGLNENHRMRCHHKTAKLVEREDILDLAADGVDKFKIARKRHHHPLDHDNTRGLAYMFNHVPSACRKTA